MENKKYKMSFTAGTLLHKESVTIAELYLELGDWKLTMEQAISSNILQTRTTSSAKRINAETVNRLKCLNDDELKLLLEGSHQEQVEIVWLAICRYYPFIRDFSVEVIRDKISTFSSKLSHEDFNIFFNSKMQWHEELEDIAETTRHKLRQVLFKMLSEAKFLNKDNTISLLMLSPRVVSLINRTSTEELLIYPVTDRQLQGYSNDQ